MSRWGWLPGNRELDYELPACWLPCASGACGTWCLENRVALPHQRPRRAPQGDVRAGQPHPAWLSLPEADLLWARCSVGLWADCALPSRGQD